MYFNLVHHKFWRKLSIKMVLKIVKKTFILTYLKSFGGRDQCYKTFHGRKPTRVDHLALPTNVRLGWKRPPGANNLGNL